jgi:hypothetical protein
MVLLLVALSSWAYWAFQPPHSQLFADLKTMSSGPDATGSYDLLTSAGSIWLADVAIDQLLEDGFVPENYFTVEGKLALCGLYTLPIGQEIQLRRGNILRLDSYVYYVSVVVDDRCFLTSATGRIGHLAMP